MHSQPPGGGSAMTLDFANLISDFSQWLVNSRSYSCHSFWHLIIWEAYTPPSPASVWNITKALPNISIAHKANYFSLWQVFKHKTLLVAFSPHLSFYFSNASAVCYNGVSNIQGSTSTHYYPSIRVSKALFDIFCVKPSLFVIHSPLTCREWQHPRQPQVSEGNKTKCMPVPVTDDLDKVKLVIQGDHLCTQTTVTTSY